jgi:prolipoprotein diacylglyceryl transferase
VTLLHGLGMLASIPSPSSNSIGPLRAYGLMIGLGVLAAIEIASRRWKDRGGDPNDFWSLAIWAVPAGLIGARLYHVITDWKTYFGAGGEPIEALFIWQGGLGIPGGIILGTAVGAYVGHRRGMRLPVGLDCVAPAFPVAQAIGRIGNYFNQEVFGRPTDLPWGLEIDPAFRPSQYADQPTFHPTFLYEGLWNLALAGFLIWFDRKRVVRPGNLFVMYVGGYALGRLWVEALRSDDASLILGVRVNIWMSVLTLVGVGVVFAVRGFRRREGDSDEPYRETPGEASYASGADDASGGGPGVG